MLKLFIINLTLCMTLFANCAHASVYEDLARFHEFQGFSAAELQEIKNSSVQNESGNAVAVCVKQPEFACYIITKNQLIDVSVVEALNLSKLGSSAHSDYERVETKPTAWISSDAETHTIEFSTLAWREEQRYSAKEVVVIQQGQYIQR